MGAGANTTYQSLNDDSVAIKMPEMKHKQEHMFELIKGKARKGQDKEAELKQTLGTYGISEETITKIINDAKEGRLFLEKDWRELPQIDQAQLHRPGSRLDFVASPLPQARSVTPYPAHAAEIANISALKRKLKAYTSELASMLENYEKSNIRNAPILRLLYLLLKLQCSHLMAEEERRRKELTITRRAISTIEESNEVGTTRSSESPEGNRPGNLIIDAIETSASSNALCPIPKIELNKTASNALQLGQKLLQLASAVAFGLIYVAMTMHTSKAALGEAAVIFAAMSFIANMWQIYPTSPVSLLFLGAFWQTVKNRTINVYGVIERGVNEKLAAGLTGFLLLIAMGFSVLGAIPVVATCKEALTSVVSDSTVTGIGYYAWSMRTCLIFNALLVFIPLLKQEIEDTQYSFKRESGFTALVKLITKMIGVVAAGFYTAGQIGKVPEYLSTVFDINSADPLNDSRLSWTQYAAMVPLFSLNAVYLIRGMKVYIEFFENARMHSAAGADAKANNWYNNPLVIIATLWATMFLTGFPGVALLLSTGLFTFTSIVSYFSAWTSNLGASAGDKNVVQTTRASMLYDGLAITQRQYQDLAKEGGVGSNTDAASATTMSETEELPSAAAPTAIRQRLAGTPSENGLSYHNPKIEEYVNKLEAEKQKVDAKIAAGGLLVCSTVRTRESEELQSKIQAAKAMDHNLYVLAPFNLKMAEFAGNLKVIINDEISNNKPWTKLKLWLGFGSCALRTANRVENAVPTEDTVRIEDTSINSSTPLLSATEAQEAKQEQTQVPTERVQVFADILTSIRQQSARDHQPRRAESIRPK